MRRFLLATFFLLSLGCQPGQHRSSSEAIQDPNAGGPVREEIAYAQREGVPLLADVYRPDRNSKAPAVILVHGGSWSRGKRDRMDRVAARAVERGFVVVNIEYRLAPEHRYPRGVEDISTAVCWTRRNAASLGVDPEQIALWGYSAGGHLSVLAASRPGSPNAEDDCPPEQARVQACVAGSAPSDLRLFGDIQPLRALLGAGPDEAPELYEEASTTLAVGEQTPPTFLYHGRTDWIVDVEHSRRLRGSLESAGVPVELVENDRGHFSQAVFAEEPIEKALDFLEQQFADSDGKAAPPGLE